MLAWSSEGAWFRQDGEWVLTVEDGVSFCAETPAGDILVFTLGGSDPYDDVMYLWRRAAASISAAIQIVLVPGSDDLRIRKIFEDSSGLYLITERPSRVFRLAGDPVDGRWELVAGPYNGSIDDMAVLNDGSLLVFDGSRNHISLHRPH